MRALQVSEYERCKYLNTSVASISNKSKLIIWQVNRKTKTPLVQKVAFNLTTSVFSQCPLRMMIVLYFFVYCVF